MNTKLLGKTLVASALVLTTLGTGLHSSYLGLDTNKVVKTAKAEENKTTGQLWKNVKDSLIDSKIISGNRDEEIIVTYLVNSGYTSSVSAPGDSDGSIFSQKIDFNSLKQIEMKKQNIKPDDFNTRVNANTTWNSLTKKLYDKGLVSKGQSVSIHCSDNSPTITGKVGEDYNENKDLMLEKRFINKITIE